MLGILLSLLLSTFPGDSEWCRVDEAAPLQELLSQQEYQDYNKKPRYRERLNQYRKAFERLSAHVVGQSRARDGLSMKRSLKIVVDLGCLTFYEPSREDWPKDVRSKQARKIEIQVRKLRDTLYDVEYRFPVDMNPAFDLAIASLDRLREQLLRGIFGHDVKKEGPGAEIQGPAAFRLLSSAPSGESRAAVPSGDQFTEQELDDLRFFQELDERVDLFLEIAESRLNEIERRMKGGEYQPPKKKKRKRDDRPYYPEDSGENPLQFYTYENLVHAYQRAIDGITVNIDEKFRHKTADEKAIRKAVKKLNERIQEFIPRLEPIKRMAIESRDEPLYREVILAEQISDVARKGSQMFLGAPEK